MYQSILDFSENDTAFQQGLKANIAASKHLDDKKTFWPTAQWKSTFMKRFNLKTSQKEGTAYSRTGLVCQLVPSLEMTFALRLLFNIPAGKGRVLNGDESLNYRFDEKSKSWRF